ncbi:Uma2 family endonuclease [Cyanobacteria bacterium FACHB-DQ100]|uniref:Uma2 family endonuclease n=1 Tax=Leptolyngbya sp. DQ-M1 TaxID=2933920 RepID=UPI001990C0DC|nr:Uma2 family endonuclease [Cyanobacteria bacterium FACHB-DQ100]
MVQTPAKSLTLEEFLRLPETKPASEYIGGQIIQKPMPQGKHSVVQGELTPAINTELKSKRLGRAFPELRCTFGGRSIVPDVSVFTWDRIPRDANGEVANTFQIAPDWMIEILSPDQSPTKVIKNILHCIDYQTQMGWLIDPDEKVVFVYFADRTIRFFDVPEQLLPVPSFASNIQLTVQTLFGWLSE